MNTGKLKGPEKCCKWQENVKAGFCCMYKIFKGDEKLT
jgi:hypothetical protein